MRFFAAIELPDQIRRQLAAISQDWQEQWGEELLGLSSDEYPRASWVRPQNFHVTLKFFGEVHESNVPVLCDALSSVAVPPAFRIKADRVECLPPRGPVRVIAVGIGGDAGALRQLYAAVELKCEAAGFPADRGDYHPHITLARAKTPLPRYARSNLVNAGAARLPTGEAHVGEFVLMESRLVGPTGPEYIPVARFPLKPV
jgi:RNA 2',3'-cyclic 3'-phosphodiesterase